MLAIVVLAWAVLGAISAWAAIRLLLSPSVSPLLSVLPVAAALVVAPVVGGRDGIAMAGIAFASVLVGGAIGYAVTVYATLREPDRTPEKATPLTPDAPQRTAVVYFTHGEPEFYDPEPWINMLWELKHTVPQFPPRMVWPMVLGGIKRSYGVVGTSPHGPIHERILARVAAEVGEDVDWHLGFLDAAPPLRDAARDAARSGATDMVFLTVFLTDSDHTAEADDLAVDMGLEKAGIRWVRTPVLWDDPRLARLIADKVERAVGDRDQASTGVALVGHGQPHEWDEEHPTETEQEEAFRSAVRAELLSRGFRPELVEEGWMSFREPTVPNAVRDLIEHGARTVVGVPVTISADSLHSLHDTPQLVRKGCRGSDVEIVDVGAWNDEDLLVEILADRTRDALRTLRGPQAVPEASEDTRAAGGGVA